jgi:hypothetical protein
VKQVSDADVKCLCHDVDIEKAYVALASLHTADVGAMQPTTISELFLRQARSLAQHTNGQSKRR